MAVPDFQTLMLPLLKLAGDGQQHVFAEAVESLGQEFQLSDDDRTQLLKSGQTRFYNRVGWTTTYLKKAGLLQAVGPGRFQLTDRGRELLTSPPAAIDIAFLESRFPEMSEFRKARSMGEAASEEPPATFNTDGTWQQREGVEERIREVMERSVPNQAVRRAALDFLALAIDNADEERSNGWCLRDTEQGLRVMTGRLLACDVGRSTMRVSVIGPVGDEVRSTLGAEIEKDAEFKTIPGGLLLTFPIDHAAEAVDLLRDGFNAFVDMAMARVRRPVSLEDHVPEAVVYIASIVGRELPQPEPVAETKDSEQPDDASDEDDIGASREPRARGRVPIFELGQRNIATLMSDIEREVIALPDLQRPFVWEDKQVRELLDSLFVGFPVGTLVFWHTANDKDARALGAERPGLRATTLVIDGQQRLTSLYAVMRGVDVIGKDGATRRITIAFRPRDGRFQVADAAIRNDPEFLPNVTELWTSTRTKLQIRKDLMNALRDKGRVVDEDYQEAAEHNLERAHAISNYQFPTVDIRKTTNAEEVTEEDVADIFVRINNQGTRLGQADFVLTLLSVYHGELRDHIEQRARAMSLGTVVGIDTQQLLRAVCGVAFGRARMSAVYRYLRGVDPTTGEADTAGRLKRLDQLDDAAKECMEPTPWRDFLLRVQHAGFVSQSLVASKNAIVNAYFNQVANLADVGWHENSVIGGRGPADYVPRLREKLAIDDDRWGRLCAEHALPLGWESMEYEEFLRERRRRMADIIRVAFRKLGGEPDAPPLTPPWFLPGTEAVWQRIVETERALRGVVRDVYAARFGESAARKIEEGLPEREREAVARALRARPAGSEPLSMVDYLYLGQLPPLLFAADAWQDARRRLGDAPDVKQRLQSALDRIAPVRNEIAHVREVDRDRLLRASVACADVLEMLRGRT